MSPFACPNDTRKDPVNRMIHKLLAKRDSMLKGCDCLPKLTSHGNPIYPTKAEIARETKKYANIRSINNKQDRAETRLTRRFLMLSRYISSFLYRLHDGWSC